MSGVRETEGGGREVGLGLGGEWGQGDGGRWGWVLGVRKRERWRSSEDGERYLEQEK